MSHEIEIEGISYISSKRASELTGYAQDYIGQLARKSLIDARRVGGLWYISMDSLMQYKNTAENWKPEPPTYDDERQTDRVVLFDGNEYFSASRAAELSGYNPDYVGQLARSGAILSHQIGNRWYVEKKSLLNHKKEKDALLAAVQVQSVGLARAVPQPLHIHKNSEHLLDYTVEEHDLTPRIEGESEDSTPQNVEREAIEVPQKEIYTIPIRRVQQVTPIVTPRVLMPRAASQSRFADFVTSPKLPLLVGTLATIVIVLTLGFTSLKQSSVYASAVVRPPRISSLTASAASAFSDAGAFLERYLTRELVYVRPSDQ